MELITPIKVYKSPYESVTGVIICYNPTFTGKIGLQLTYLRDSQPTCRDWIVIHLLPIPTISTMDSMDIPAFSP